MGVGYHFTFGTYKIPGKFWFLGPGSSDWRLSGPGELVHSVELTGRHDLKLRWSPSAMGWSHRTPPHAPRPKLFPNRKKQRSLQIEASSTPHNPPQKKSQPHLSPSTHPGHPLISPSPSQGETRTELCVIPDSPR